MLKDLPVSLQQLYSIMENVFNHLRAKFSPADRNYDKCAIFTVIIEQEIQLMHLAQIINTFQHENNKVKYKFF